MDMGRNAIAESTLLDAVVVGGAGSRGELCEALGLSKAAVTQTVGRLLERQLLYEGHLREENRVGRKTRTLSVKPDLGYFLGTDLEGLAVRGCVMDCAGNIIAQNKRAIAPTCSRSKFLRQWQQLVAGLLEQVSSRRDRIVGMGVGLPGCVDQEKLTSRAYLPPGKWVNIDIAYFKEEFGLDVATWNNVVCISEYERKVGVAVDEADFLCVLVRYGIGASLCTNGLLTAGKGLSTGELGHMRIDMKGKECICGSRGCLDVYASGRTWESASKATGAAFTRQLQARGRYLAVAVANMLKLFHRPLVIIDGIYNDYEHVVKPAFVETLERELDGLRVKMPDVVFGDPVEMKASMGAATQAAGKFFKAYLDRVLQEKAAR